MELKPDIIRIQPDVELNSKKMELKIFNFRFNFPVKVITYFPAIRIAISP